MPGEHPHNQLGDKGLYSLACATKLRDEKSAAMGIDDGRKRSTLTKRLYVSGCRKYWQRCKTQMLTRNDRGGFYLHARLFFDETADDND